jgi:hypothetical protein
MEMIKGTDNLHKVKYGLDSSHCPENTFMQENPFLLPVAAVSIHFVFNTFFTSKLFSNRVDFLL